MAGECLGWLIRVQAFFIRLFSVFSCHFVQIFIINSYKVSHSNIRGEMRIVREKPKCSVT